MAKHHVWKKLKHLNPVPWPVTAVFCDDEGEMRREPVAFIGLEERLGYNGPPLFNTRPTKERVIWEDSKATLLFFGWRASLENIEDNSNYGWHLVGIEHRSVEQDWSEEVVAYIEECRLGVAWREIVGAVNKVNQIHEDLLGELMDKSPKVSSASGVWRVWVTEEAAKRNDLNALSERFTAVAPAIEPKVTRVVFQMSAAR